jgi:hypothetical protein
MAHLPTAHSRESSYHQHCNCNYRKCHWSNQHDHNDHQSDFCHQDDQRHDRPWRDNKDSKSSRSYDKKDDCKWDYSKKKSNEAMNNDQSSKLSAGNLSGKKSWSCSKSPSCSQSWSCSCSSSWSYDHQHVNQDDCKSSPALKRQYLYSSKSDDGGCIHCPDKSDSVFATFSTPKAKKKCTQK